MKKKLYSNVFVGELRMSNTSDFVIENGVLLEYVGPGGDVVMPDGVANFDNESLIWYKPFRASTCGRSLSE